MSTTEFTTYPGYETTSNEKATDVTNTPDGTYPTGPTLYPTTIEPSTVTDTGDDNEGIPWYEILAYTILAVVVVLVIGFIILACCVKAQMNKLTKGKEVATDHQSDVGEVTMSRVEAVPNHYQLDTSPAERATTRPETQMSTPGAVQSTAIPTNNIRESVEYADVAADVSAHPNPVSSPITQPPYPVSPPVTTPIAEAPAAEPANQTGTKAIAVQQQTDAIYEDELEREGVLLPSVHRPPPRVVRSSAAYAPIYDDNRRRQASRMYPPKLRAKYVPPAPVPKSEGHYYNAGAINRAMMQNPARHSSNYYDDTANVTVNKEGVYYIKDTGDTFYTSSGRADPGHYYTGGRAMSDSHVQPAYTSHYADRSGPSPYQEVSKRTSLTLRGDLYDRASPVAYGSLQPPKLDQPNPYQVTERRAPPPADYTDYLPDSGNQYFQPTGLYSQQPPAPTRPSNRPSSLVFPDPTVPISPSPLSPEQIKLQEMMSRYTRAGDKPFTYTPHGF